MQILIVEDNPVSATMLKVNLQNHGFDVLQAQNGQHALGMMKAAEKPIDIIISDVMMPEMDGFEMLEKLKSNDTWKNVPVIMCTGLNDVSDIKRAMALGCKHYILKPIKVKHIYSKIQDVIIENTTAELNTLEDQGGLQDERISKEIAFTFSRLVNQKIKFLEEQVADDTDMEIAQKFADLKEAADCFGAKWIKNILSRLEEIQTRQNGTLDVQQHFTLLRELKKLYSILPQNEMSDEKITMVEQIDDFRKCISKYSPNVLKKFDHMIQKLGYVKPSTCYAEKVESGMVAFDDVWATVGKLLIARGQEVDEQMMTRLKRFAVNSHVIEPFRMVSFDDLLHIPPENQKSPEVAEREKNSGKTAGEASLIDVKIAMEVVDGDKMLFQELFEDFLKTLPQQLDAMLECIARQDVKSLHKFAHDLKGTSGNLGVTTLCKCAQELEQNARALKLDGAETLVHQMKKIVAKVMVQFFDTDWSKK